VNAADAEGIAFACAISAGIEPFDDFFYPKRARGPVAVQIELENEPYRFGFDRIDREFLLDLCAPLLGLHQPITKRSRGAVPEPLPGVLLHRADHVLGVFFGLILIEERNNLAHHRVNRFALIADWLGDGNHPNVMLGQFAKIEFLFKGLAEEATVAVDHD
jgi:hypothetical protein